jgi:hypothetical protein
MAVDEALMIVDHEGDTLRIEEDAQGEFMLTVSTEDQKQEVSVYVTIPAIEAIATWANTVMARRIANASAVEA